MACYLPLLFSQALVLIKDGLAAQLERRKGAAAIHGIR